MKVGMKLSLACAVLFPVVAQATTLNHISTTGDPSAPFGSFYGYRSTGDGPGRDAFQKCLSLAESTTLPLFLVVGSDSCSTCSSFCDMMNEWSRAAPVLFAACGGVNAYFRGTDTATDEARAFLKNTLGCPLTCHVMCCYGLAGDGTIYKSYASLSTEYVKFGTWMKNQSELFKKYASAHTGGSTPTPTGTTTCSSAFALEKTELTQGTATLNVPFIRTNNTTKAETHYLKVTNTDSKEKTYTLSWTKGTTEKALSVTVTWKKNGTVKLVLQDSSKKDVDTRTVKCVEAATADVGFACSKMALAEGVSTLYVPFDRMTNGTSKAETLYLAVTDTTGASVTTNLDWAVSEIEKEFPLPLTWKKDGEATLVLMNSDKKAVATQTVACVAMPTNSFAFPRFVGECEYAFGEWTLDFEAATSAVANAKSCILAVSGVSTADPRLQAYAKQVLSATSFTNWATDNEVALVLLDEVNKTGQGLLTHSHGEGDCYHSLKGLRTYAATAPAAGDEVELSAQAMQLYLGALNDCYGTPLLEMELVLIRPDGSVAGRLNPQEVYDAKAKTWSFDADENVARLAELLKEAADATEETNGGRSTALRFDWPKTVSTAEVNGQTLAVSDTNDWYRLEGDGWAGRKIVFELEASGVNAAATPRFEVMTNGVVAQPSVDWIYSDAKALFAETNYVFDAADIAASNVYVRAIAFDGPAARTEVLGGDTRFAYSLKARPIASARGVVSFLGEGDRRVLKPEDQSYEVSLVRALGFSEPVSARVSVDTDLTTTDLYEFTETNVTWQADEIGAKGVNITLKGTNVADGVKQIVLRLDINEDWTEITNKTEKVRKLYNLYSISYGQEPTDRGELGIDVKDVEPVASADGRVYLRKGGTQALRIPVSRDGGKGRATGFVTLSAGKVRDVITYEWDPYQVGVKTDGWLAESLPDPGSSGFVDATVKLTGSNDFPVVAGADTVKVRILRADAPAFGKETEVDETVQNIAYEKSVSLATDLPEEWTVDSAMKISGSLPRGLKVSADKETGALAIAGTPTVATEEPVTSIWWIKFRDENGAVVMSSPITLKIGVKALAKTEDNPQGLVPGFDAARSWTGLPLVNAETKRLAGLLDLTVSKTGKTSAKWRKVGGKSVSFSASKIAYDTTGRTNVNASATKRQYLAEHTLDVRFWTDGTIDGSVSGDGEAAAFRLTTPEPWSVLNPAAEWAGSYTLAFPHDVGGAWDEKTRCFGPATVSVRFTSAAQLATGKATFAGVLPNGKSVSGTAVFVPAGEGAESTELPIFSTSSTDTFGAIVTIPAETESGASVAPSAAATNFWQHAESGFEEASYENDYTVVGAYYEAQNWEELWSDVYKTDTLGFGASVTNETPSDLGASVTAKAATLKVSDKGEIGLSFSLVKSTGLASGSFKDAREEAVAPLADGARANWRGVALPGFPAFMTGAYWYTVKIPYKDAKDKVRLRSVKAGGAVSLEPLQDE